MKSKSKGFRALTALVALAFCALAAAVIYVQVLDYKASHRAYVEELIYDGTRELVKKINSSDANAVKGYNFGIWEDESAHVNAVVIDAQGKIVASSGTLFIEGRDHLNLMVSPYLRSFEEWKYYDARGGSSGGGRDGHLALLVDDEGEIQESFVAFETPGAVGEDLPRYRTYFPAIDEDYYEQLDNWYSWDTEDRYSEFDADWYDGDYRDDYDGETNRSTLLKRAQTRKYAQWEGQWVQWAGQKRLIYTPIKSGQALLTMFYGDEELYREEIRANQLWDQISAMGTTILPLIVLCWFLLAVWVFADARRRGDRPALWGALALLGGPVTWIIYLMVRPAADNVNVCPVCGAPVKREYVCCPICAEPLRPRCDACGRALEARWKACPYCGKPVQAAENGQSAEKSDS